MFNQCLYKPFWSFKLVTHTARLVFLDAQKKRKPGHMTSLCKSSAFIKTDSHTHFVSVHQHMMVNWITYNGKLSRNLVSLHACAGHFWCMPMTCICWSYNQHFFFLCGPLFVLQSLCLNLEHICSNCFFFLNYANIRKT